jgi:hypothetical protein
VCNKLLESFLFHLVLQKDLYLYSDLSMTVNFLKTAIGKPAHVASDMSFTFYFAVLSKV